MSFPLYGIGCGMYIYDGDLNEQGGLQIVLTVRLTSYLYFVTVDAQNTKYTATTVRYSIS